MSLAITCLIVEDEPPAMQLLDDYIRKLPMLELKGKCYDALEAMKYLKKEKVDVIFLDINLPALSGLEMASLIPKDQKIIFTTAYGEHALDSFAFQVVDYLLKPIPFGRFLQAIQKLQHFTSTRVVIKEQTQEKSPELFFIKTGRQVISILYADILYIEAHKEYLCIHTKGQKHMVYRRMKEMATSLPRQFIRIHNSYIVNMQHLQKTSAQSVTIGGLELPVSSSYKEPLQTRLKEYLL